MGSEHSRGSSGAPAKPVADQVKTEGDLLEQPARNTPSDMGNETVEAQSTEGSASPAAPQQEEVNSFPLPAEEPEPPELRENFQEGGEPPYLSQSASSDKGPPTIGQVCDSDIATHPVERSSETAEYAAPQVPLEPEPGLLFFARKAPSVGPGLQVAAEDLCCSAESPVWKRPGEISPCSPAEQEHGSQACHSEEGSFEVIPEVHPEPAAPQMVEGQADLTTALVTEPLEAQGSVAAESMAAKTVRLPSTETQVRQNKGRSARIAGGESKTAAKTPEEADSETPLAQQALDIPEKPLASLAVEHADAKFIDGLQNDGGYFSAGATSLGKEPPAPATARDPEAAPHPDHLAEPSSREWQALGEAKELSPVKETGGTCSAPEAIEMAEAQVGKLAERPQTVHVSCTVVTLAPVALETQPMATADVNAQLQGTSGAQKDSAVRKPETRFPKTFYFCCSQCRAGDRDGEANAEQ